MEMDSDLFEAEDGVILSVSDDMLVVFWPHRLDDVDEDVQVVFDGGVLLNEARTALTALATGTVCSPDQVDMDDISILFDRQLNPDPFDVFTFGGSLMDNLWGPVGFQEVIIFMDEPKATVPWYRRAPGNPWRVEPERQPKTLCTTPQHIPPAASPQRKMLLR